MKAALSIGARVIPVDVARDQANYVGSWEGRISGEARRIQVTAETYEEALQVLRSAIVAAMGGQPVFGGSPGAGRPS
jgi:hypothetical protein